MKRQIRLVGGNNAFETFIRECAPELDVVRFATPADAVATDPADCRAFLILPDYRAGKTNVPEMHFDTLKAFSGLKHQGQHLFIENYDAGDYSHSAVFGHQVDGGLRHFFNESLVAQDDLKAVLPDGFILQARDAYFHPGRAMGYHTDFGKRVLLKAADCVGTHDLFKQETFSFPVLAQVDNYYCSAMNMTEFKPEFRTPVFRWRRLFAWLFAQVLDVSEEKAEAAFDRVWQPVGIAGKSRASDMPVSRQDIAASIEKVVAWHQACGIMLKPDGTAGCYEMIRSNNLGVRANHRADSALITGLLFYAAGKQANKPQLQEIGENLIRFMLDNHLQVEDGESAGFFKWFLDVCDSPRTIYSSDSSRCGIAMVNMYKLSGKAEYLQRAVKLGDAILRWLASYGLSNGCFSLAAGPQKHLQEGQTDNPVFYAEMTSFLLQLHKLTGNAKYKDAVLRYAEKIMATFPNTKPFGFSDNFTYSRYLMMIVFIQEAVNVDHSNRINQVLDYVAALQHSSGGLREMPIRLADHAEAGVGIGDDSDNIADMLYCNNFVLAALSVIIRMKNPHAVNLPLARSLYDKLLRFIISIQIESPNPKLAGGWMRAFDMDHGEYYGLNKDKDWGAYCIMAGWVTGFIPLTLLAELDEESIWL